MSTRHAGPYEEDDCPDCIGTGIGWNGPESSCGTCNGSGVVEATVFMEPDDYDDYNADQLRVDNSEDDYLYDPLGDD